MEPVGVVHSVLSQLRKQELEAVTDWTVIFIQKQHSFSENNFLDLSILSINDFTHTHACASEG